MVKIKKRISVSFNKTDDLQYLKAICFLLVNHTLTLDEDIFNNTPYNISNMSEKATRNYARYLLENLKDVKTSKGKR